MNAREMVKAYWDAVEAGDWDTWLSLFDENVVMEETVSGTTHGLDELKDRIHGYFQKGFKEFVDAPLEVVAEKDRAMVIVSIKAVTATGVKIDCKGGVFFKVKNGKIVYLANYHESLPFRSALEAAAAAS